MTPNQFRAARQTLRWSHERLGEALGVSRRTPFRYAAGDVVVPEPVARLLRLLVYLRLTVSTQRFDQIVGEICRKKSKTH